MKSLYARIAENTALQENIEFSSEMGKLFDSSFQGIRDIPELPIEAKKTSWEEISDFDKNYLTRTFSFDRHKHLRFFVSEVLRESDEMMHHPQLKVDSSSVSVSLYTHDINDISELDLKLAKFIDEIFDDVKFIQEF